MKAIKNTNGRRVILALILVAVAIELVRHNVGTCFVIEGDSMYPTFRPGDVVLAKTFPAEWKRGDMLILTDNRGERVIKRIIGLPGETVTIYRGSVYINSQRLSEPYLPQHTYTFESNTEIMRRADWRLGDNQFFVMGDNRIASCDSRQLGPVGREQIHSIVALSENAARPALCEMMLSESGELFRGKPSPGKNQTRSIRRLAAVAIPNFVRAGTASQTNACINNLHQVDGAIQQWALETKQTPTANVVPDNVTPYLKSPPSCPAYARAAGLAGFQASDALTTVSNVPACAVVPATPILP